MKPNPHYYSWTIQVQESFLSFAFDYYIKKHGNPQFIYQYPHCKVNLLYKPKLEIDTIQRLFDLGNNLQQLQMDFISFKNFFYYGQDHISKYRYGSRTYPSWYQRHGIGYRCKQSYRRNINQQTKPISQEQIQCSDWRKRKGFQIDQAKNRGRPYKGGRYYKDIDHRSRRAYERVMLDNERWDKLAGHEHKDSFTSSWDWY